MALQSGRLPNAPGSAQGSGPAGLRGLEPANARYTGPAQPSPALGDALNAGYLYLEVRCLGCDTHQTVALDIVRRPKVPYPRTGTLHAVQGLLAGPTISLQAQPSCGAAVDEDTVVQDEHGNWQWVVSLGIPEKIK
jgi:hypothetical protein